MKIFLIETHGVLRVALAMNFAEMGYQVVGEAADLDQADQAMAAARPHLCVIGVSGFGEAESHRLAHHLNCRHGVASLLLTDQYAPACPQVSGVVGCLIVPAVFESFRHVMRLVEDHLKGRRAYPIPACLSLSQRQA